MKSILLVTLLVGAVVTAGCSKPEKKEITAQPQSTPDVARLKSDSERLQQATANAAKAREQAAAGSPTPAPTVSP